MATKPKSYKKGSYTYTESSQGSNKFQNFTAKPTVKKVRDDSRKDKADVAVKKAAPKSTAKSTTKPGESKMATTEATRKPRGMEKRFPSAEERKIATVGQSQRFRPAPVARGVSGSDAKGKRGIGVRLLKYFGYPAGTKTTR